MHGLQNIKKKNQITVLLFWSSCCLLLMEEFQVTNNFLEYLIAGC